MLASILNAFMDIECNVKHFYGPLIPATSRERCEIECHETAWLADVLSFTMAPSAYLIPLLSLFLFLHLGLHYHLDCSKLDRIWIGLMLSWAN